MIDLHNHTPLCHHASGEPDAMVRRAAALGLREYGFAEHSPWMHQYEGEQIAPTEEEFDQYVRLVEELRGTVAAEAGIALRLGIELDFIPGKEAHAESFLRKYSFDHVVGSVHNIGQWIFDHPDHLDAWEEKDDREVFEEYFALVKRMLQWGNIDILGHLDLPKKFGFVPRDGYEDLVEDLIPLILDAGIVVEVNTAGREKPIAEFYPSADIVQLLANEGVRFTISSDAHKLESVAKYHEDALALLRSAGVREIYSFEKRKPIAYPI